MGRGRLRESGAAVSRPTVESCSYTSEHPEGPMCETKDQCSSSIIVVRSDNWLYTTYANWRILAARNRVL